MEYSECKVMYREGPMPCFEDVVESISEQLGDLGGELDENTLIIPPVGTTELQFTQAMSEIFDADQS
jgi:hypothetical protein